MSGLSMVLYCFERGVLDRVIYARRLSLVYEAVFRLDFSDQLQSRAPEFMHGATLCGAQGRIVFQKMEYSAQDTYGRAKWSLVHGMFTKSGKFIQGGIRSIWREFVEGNGVRFIYGLLWLWARCPGRGKSLRRRVELNCSDALNRSQ
jgi:hypothetical protein